VELILVELILVELILVEWRKIDLWIQEGDLKKWNGMRLFPLLSTSTSEAM
jgi:hypothetical protein